MRRVDLQEAATIFLDLVDEIERTGEAIIITRDGKPVARLEPIVVIGAD